jgi:hypothetical protein
MKEITCFNDRFLNFNKFSTSRLSPTCTSTRSQCAHLRTREVDARHSPQKQSTQLPGNISCKSSQTPPWRSPAPARWRSRPRLRPCIVALLQREVHLLSMNPFGLAFRCSFEWSKASQKCTSFGVDVHIIDEMLRGGILCGDKYSFGSTVQGDQDACADHVEIGLARVR